MDTALTIGLVLAGSCVGSYCATSGLRMARGEQSATGRSCCDTCGIQLGFLDTAPIVSYLRLRGACAGCGGRIDPLHLAGEISGAVIVAVSVLVAAPLRAAALAFVGFVLLTACVVDVRTRRLPDMLTAMVAAGALVLCFQKGLAATVAGLVAGAAAFVLLEIVRRAFLRLRGRAGLGFGDVKLLAVLAVLLGPATSWALALAAASGLVAAATLRPADGRIAFGPFIAAAGWGVAAAMEAGVAPWP